MTLADLPYTTSDLFPSENFAFHMRLRRGEVAQFFRNHEQHAAVLSERQKWLGEDPGKYAATLDDSEPLIEEAFELAQSCGVVATRGKSIFESMVNLGGAWEPDLLLLKNRSASEQPILLAECVCFPSSWAPEEKIGKPLDAIHAPVPTLNEQFANPVQQFLARMKPGISWERINWGLSRSPELNQHPSRNLPRLNQKIDLDEVWFRAEYQSLVSLPKTGGVLFGIRLVIEPLAKLCADTEFVAGLRRAIETMPEPIAIYKGIAPARQRLLELFETVQKKKA